jgi:hypothetical protein
MQTTNTIEKLNLFLRDELAAVATYEEALRGRSAATGKHELSLCQRSHERRVAALRIKITALGGTPASSSGLRGGWEKALERGAAAVSQDMAVRVLEAGEDRILREYRATLPTLEIKAREFVVDSILPDEVYTHDLVADLSSRLTH